MYDEKQEPHEFIADSRDDAIEEAASFFGIGKDALRVSEPADVYGLGGRAVVVAAPANAPRVDPGGDDDGGRGRGGRDRERGDRGGRGGGRERGGRERGGRERGGRERGGRDRGGRGGPDRGLREAGGGDEPERVRAVELVEDEPVGESKGVADGSLGEIGDFMLGAIERMQLGPFEIAESDEDDFLIYQLRGRAAEVLGSGDGRAIDALQLLANQAAMQLEDPPERVIIDVEGSSEKRESFLSRLAERAARRSTDTKRSVALDPMNPKDRRIIHVALRDTDGIATMSIGSGRYRQVVVVPEGSPEFEDAERSSRQAASQD